MDNRRAKLTAVIAAVVAVVAVIALIATTYMNLGAGQPDVTADPGPVNVEGELAPGEPLEAGEDSDDPTGDGHDVQVEEADPATERAIQDVTVRFIDAWKTPGTPEERAAALSPLATEYLTRLMARVDPRELPSKAEVLDEPKLIAFVSYAAGVEVRLTTGERLRVNLVLDTSGWRVSELLPAGPATPTPTPKPTPTPTPTPKDDAKQSDADTDSGDDEGKAG